MSGGFRSPMLRLVKDDEPVRIDKLVREREQARASVGDAFGNPLVRLHLISASLKAENELMRLAFTAGELGDDEGKRLYESAVQRAIRGRLRAEGKPER